MTEKKEKKSNKKLKDIFFYLFITLLLLFSAGMIFHSQIEGFLIKSYKSNTTIEDILKNQKNAKNANYDWDSVNPASMESIIAARASNKSINVIGAISTPEAKMNIAVAPGVANRTLLLGAGTLRSDQVMGVGNYPVASHHTVSKDALFGPLYYKSKIGQKIYLTDFNKTYIFKATKIKFIKANDVQVAENHYTKDGVLKNEITLITCDATGDKRFMVVGKLIEVKDKWSNVPSKVLNGFQKAVNITNWKDNF